jgi:hypothetical protein
VSCCEDVRALLGRYVDHELPPADVNRVDSHLGVCDACAERLRLMEREADLLRQAFEPEAASEAAGADIWPRVQRARTQRRRLRWYGLATAASVLLALGARLAMLPAESPVEIVRVAGCSGPVELCRNGDWSQLATFTILRDGDRMRCTTARGVVTLHGDRRIDLNVDTEIRFEANGGYSHFHVRLVRGSIHVDLPEVRMPLIVYTPVADVTAFSETAGVPGPARFELLLSGVPPAASWLDRLDPVPVAWAGPASPELEIICHLGSIRAVNTSGEQVAVKSGQRAVVAPTGAITQPMAARTPLDRGWWLPPRRRVAVAPPLPRQPSPAHVPLSVEPKPDESPAAEPRRAQPDVGERPDPGEKPAPFPSMEAAPPPRDLAAEPDLGGVILTWSPVAWRRPVVEYNVYRLAAQDTEPALIARVPHDAKIRRYECRDSLPGLGEERQYAAATVVREDDALKEGEFSKYVAGRSANYRIRFLGVGGTSRGDQAMILVEKKRGRAVHRHTFAVPVRDLHLGLTGEIGGPRQIVVQPMPGVRHRLLVDFSTGYRLIQMDVRYVGRDGVPREQRSITIESRGGRRHTIDMKPLK